MDRKANIKKAKKISALASAGRGGEKRNAQVLLERFLSRTGLTLADIEDTHKIRLSLSYRTKLERQLLYQIIVAASDNDAWETWFNARKKRITVVVELYAAMKIERQYSIYRKAFNKELNKTLIAFIHANHIFPLSGKSVDTKEIPPEELEELQQAVAMAEFMSRPSVRIALAESC